MAEQPVHQKNSIPHVRHQHTHQQLVKRVLHLFRNSTVGIKTIERSSQKETELKETAGDQDNQQPCGCPVVQPQKTPGRLKCDFQSAVLFAVTKHGNGHLLARIANRIVPVLVVLAGIYQKFAVDWAKTNRLNLVIAIDDRLHHRF